LTDCLWTADCWILDTPTEATLPPKATALARLVPELKKS